MVCNEVYFRTLFRWIIHILDVYINNGATVQCVFVQYNCQYSGTVFCLFETGSEMVLAASDVL